MKLLRTGKPTKSNTIPECCILQRCCSVRLRVALLTFLPFLLWHELLIMASRRQAIQVFAKPSSSPYAALGELFGTQSCCSLMFKEFFLGMAWRWNRPETSKIKWDHIVRWQWVQREKNLPVESIWGCCFYWNLVSLSGLPMLARLCPWRCHNWKSKATDNYLGVRSQFRSNGCRWLPGWSNRAMYSFEVFVSDISVGECWWYSE